ncbi:MULTISPECIES: hypothetical protein [Methanobrevibacter]|nr:MULTISPECIES: hypothetical protein [Methanobrevibacter]
MECYVACVSNSFNHVLNRVDYSKKLDGWNTPSTTGVQELTEKI